MMVCGGGLITIVAKRFDMACSTVYQLWEWVAHTCAIVILFLQKLIPGKQLQEECYISDRVCPGGCQGCPTVEEAYPEKTCNADGCIEDNCALLDCWFDHSCSL